MILRNVHNNVIVTFNYYIKVVIKTCITKYMYGNIILYTYYNVYL